jgi:hypothetical protein
MSGQPDGLETEPRNSAPRFSPAKPASRSRPVRPAPGEARGFVWQARSLLGPRRPRLLPAKGNINSPESNDRGETTACFDPSLNWLTLLPDDALELNLQNGRMRPFTVLAEFDVAYDRVEGRAVSESRHQYYLSHQWPGRRGASQIARSRECVNALFSPGGGFPRCFCKPCRNYGNLEEAERVPISYVASVDLRYESRAP